MEVYVDDMIVKAKNIEDHVSKLEWAFSIIKCYGMLFNLKKCLWSYVGKVYEVLVAIKGN